MATGRKGPERQAENAADVASMHREMAVEVVSDSVIAQAQTLFNQHFQELLSRGHNRNQVDPSLHAIDQQALMDFGDFEGGELLNLPNNEEGRFNRFHNWMRRWAADLGFDSVGDLYSVLFPGGVSEAKSLMRSDGDFKATIIRVYRDLGKLADALIARHWILPKLTATFSQWPDAEDDRRQLFTQIFNDQIKPEIWSQYPRQRSRNAVFSRQSALDEAAFSERADRVLKEMLPHAANASDIGAGRRLLERAGQQLIYETFIPTPVAEHVRMQRMTEIDRMLDAFGRDRPWVAPPIPHVAAGERQSGEAAPEARVEQGGARPQENRQEKPNERERKQKGGAGGEGVVPPVVPSQPASQRWRDDFRMITNRAPEIIFTAAGALIGGATSSTVATAYLLGIPLTAGAAGLAAVGAGCGYVSSKVYKYLQRLNKPSA